MPVRTTVITGATSGIGKETALALAKQGHGLYLLARNVEKGEELKRELIEQTKNHSIFVVKCDLADLNSVKAAADELKSKLFGINVLINNAGGIFARRELSKDGFEMTFAINHLGHFLLTTSLRPLLERGQARIINVSSEAHKMGRPVFKDLNAVQDYSAFKVYGMAKLFNIYFTKSLAEKYADKGVTAYALHPGVVKTQFWSDMSGWNKLLKYLATPFMISAEKGAQTTIYLATQSRLEKHTGQYFKKKAVAQSSLVSKNPKIREQLWEISEELVKPFTAL
jgi:NAD(P)-dependent dehydrogenase (short-subunit alcohol dehydrogenase family)